MGAGPFGRGTVETKKLPARLAPELGNLYQRVQPNPRRQGQADRRAWQTRPPVRKSENTWTAAEGKGVERGEGSPVSSSEGFFHVFLP